MLCDVLNLNLQTVFTQLNKSVRVLTTLINEKKKSMYLFTYIVVKVLGVCICIVYCSKVHKVCMNLMLLL